MCKGVRVRRAIVQCGAFLSVFLTMAVALLGGCTAHPPAPPNYASHDYSYLIGPLETLNSSVWHNADLSTTVPVRPDGKVSVPLVEDLPALGKNPSQLARDIEKAMSKFIRD